MASLLEKYGWREWLCHTNFSFLTGASHPHELINRASMYGYKGLGICDFDGAYGLARSYRALVKLKKTEPSCELGLFYGAEIHLQKDHDAPVVLQDTLVLMAKSRIGYFNLCKILSYSHREGKRNAYTPWEYLKSADVTDIVAYQPMRGAIRYAKEKDLAERFSCLTDIFRDQFYFVISRHLNPSEDFWIPKILDFIKYYNGRCILSQDVFFHSPDQKAISDLLHAIRSNKVMDSAVDQMFVNTERSLHSLSGIEARYSQLPVYQKALRDSYHLAESFDFSLSELKYSYPKEMIPEGHTALSWLEDLTWKGAKKRFGQELSPKILSTLARELKLIEELGFVDYFLTVWDIVCWARKQGILCQGRGSAANSAVCFVLGITAVDPSLFDLLFERFISVERGDPPDIDVDFEHERREEVIQYIYRRYGRKKAAMVANVITFKSKGCVRYTGKALGVPEVVLSKATKILVNRRHRGDSKAFFSDLNQSFPDLKTPIPWELWLKLSDAIKGFPRHLGIHSGGFMVADKDLDYLVPQEPATMEDRSVIQWCKEDIEDLGFFKIDILALGILTAIRKSFELIKQNYGKEIDLSTIPQEDKPTYSMIQRADTVGVFQIESRAQMSMLPRLRPRTFYDLVIEVAIIRPGPIQGGLIHPYLKRRDGIEPVIFPDEKLRPILARTLGIPIFQEQVMRIAMEVGGFSAGEADEFRRHMGAWQVKGDITPWLNKLEKGMMKNKIKKEFIAMILGQMKGFSDYGFPESHSVSFALLGYASSWLKCHYPASFFTSLLNSQPMGFYSPNTLVQAAKRDGVDVLPVCANHSWWDSRLEKVGNAGSAPIYGIRLGLNMVRGLSQSGAEKLVSKRIDIGGEWGDMEHFLQSLSASTNNINSETNVNKGDLIALAAAGVFNVFGVERRSALWIAEASPFSGGLEGIEEVEKRLNFSKENPMEKLQLDFAHSQCTLGEHPSRVIRDEYWVYQVPEEKVSVSTDFEKMTQGRSVSSFGMVIIRQAPPSANGMVFITLEDEVGFINLVFTPPMYTKYCQLVEKQSFLCIAGTLQKNSESHSIMVKQVYEPMIPKAEIVKMHRSKKYDNKIKTEESLQKTRNYM